jgi:hypothetical protein
MDVAARDFLLAAGILAASADGVMLKGRQRDLLLELLLPFTMNPEAQIAHIASESEARELLRSSCAWLRENAGEERFLLYRRLARIVALDGQLHDGERAFMLNVADQLSIPKRTATQMVFAVLTDYLQSVD